MRRASYRWELLLAVGSLALNLLCLGRVGLFNVDEAIFAEATREMVVTGDYVTPHYNGNVRWDKPPLTYWVMSVPLRLFGPTAFGARFASAVEGALLVLLTALFGRYVWGQTAGRWSAVVMATCLHGLLLAHWSATDMLLTLLMGTGWMALFLADERDSPGWFLAAAAALALATLTKGPVALVLPGFAWLCYLLWRRRLLHTLGATHCWWGILLYAALLAPWCVAIYLRHGMEFYRSFLGYHNLNRFATTQSGHGMPVFAFGLVALFGLLPWSGFAVHGIARAWRGRADGFAGRAGMYLLGWLVTVLGVFSLSGTKLPNYIAPLYPAAALLAGPLAAQALRPAGGRRWGWVWFLNLGGYVGGGLALLAAGWWLPRLPLEGELGQRITAVGPGPALAGAVLCLVPALVAWTWWRGRSRRALQLNLAGAAACWLALWLGVQPVVYHYQEGTIRCMADTAVKYLGPDDTLGILNIHVPSVPYTTRRLIRHYQVDERRPVTRRAVAERFAGPRRALVITRSRYRRLLNGVAPCYAWAERLGYVLVGNQPPPPGFVLPPSPWTEAGQALREDPHGR